MSGNDPDRFRAVFWDMDGTLVDSEPLHLRAFEAVLIQLGFKPPAELHARNLGQSEQHNYGWLREVFGFQISFEDWVRMRYRHYLDGIAMVAVKEDAAALWWQNEARGIPQAIVSNSDRIIVDANLRATGIARPGLVTISRNDVRAGKPDPEPYLRAAWLLGVDPRDAAVIEDSPSGLQAGLRAKMTAFYMPGMAEELNQGALPLSEFG